MKTSRFFLLFVLCGLSVHLVPQDNDDSATQKRIKKEAVVKEAEAVFNEKQKRFDEAAEELQDARNEYIRELSELTRPLLNELVDLTEKFSERYAAISPYVNANQFFPNAAAIQREIEELNESVIGVYLQNDPDTGGVLITRVTEGAPADLAGIESGDIIVAIDDVEVLDKDDPYETTASIINAKKAGSQVKIKLQRDEELVDLNVETIDRLSLRTLSNQNAGYVISTSPTVYGYTSGAAWPPTTVYNPTIPQRSSDNVFVMEIEEDFGQYFGVEYGVLVLKAENVDELQPGDILLEIDEQPIRSLSHALRYRRDADDEVELLFKRNKRDRSITLRKNQFRLNAILQ